MNKHYTFQEYIEKFSSIQDSYDYYFEQQKEIDRLNNIIKDVYEFVEWHYKDNQGFYKNKGIGLNYPECDYVLDKLKEGNKC